MFKSGGVTIVVNDLIKAEQFYEETLGLKVQFQVEGHDYMPIKPSKMSLSSSNKIYTFCLNCGEVDSIRIENTNSFKKK